jgi:hypothetical protein
MKYHNEHQRAPQFILAWVIILGTIAYAIAKLF